MTVEEFVKKLSDCAPTIDHLIANGYPANYAKEYRDGYLLRKKKTPGIPEYDDPLVRLICNYDTSKLEIGIITLGKAEYAFQTPPEKVHVGAIEADILVINPVTGVVELLDHGNPDYVIAQCAASGGRFLDSLILLASFELPYANLYVDLPVEYRIRNNEATYERALECAIVSGITTQPNIYKMVLGYNSRIK